MEPKTPSRKPQSEDKYVVRFPDDMRDRIAEAAKSNNRSMNSEIVARLGQSFSKDPTGELKQLSMLFRAQGQLMQERQEKSWILEDLAEQHAAALENVVELLRTLPTSTVASQCIGAAETALRAAKLLVKHHKAIPLQREDGPFTMAFFEEDPAGTATDVDVDSEPKMTIKRISRSKKPDPTE